MAAPRYETQLDPTLPNRFAAIEAQMVRFGQEPMDWQGRGARLIGARRPDGTPRYSTVVITVPRQSGKTTLAKGSASDRAEERPNQRLYATAQTRMDAAKHLENLGWALEAAGEDIKMRLANGSERLLWPNGTTMEVVAPTPGGGHGITIDWMLLDEVWAIEPHVMAAIIPATSANPYAQLVFISTMGTIESEVWNDLVSKGRESIEDPESEMAYLEYSAASDADVFDESKWHEFMPALGSTQSIESIRHARDTLSPNEFIRAFGNRVTTVINSVFPNEWVQASWRKLQPAQRFVVAVDVNDQPAGAAVTAAALGSDPNKPDDDSLGVGVHMLAAQPGTPVWVPSFVKGLLDQHKVEAVVGDFAGPAKQIHAELKTYCDAAGINISSRTPREIGADSLAFYDDLREGRLWMDKYPELESAIQGAKKKAIGDLWLITRTQMSVDASPLISAILAHGLAKELSVQPVVDWFVL